MITDIMIADCRACACACLCQCLCLCLRVPVRTVNTSKSSANQANFGIRASLHVGRVASSLSTNPIELNRIKQTTSPALHRTVLYNNSYSIRPAHP